MVTVNLDLILKILLSAALTIFFILLFITLIKIISFFSKINSLLKKNREQLEKSSNQIPSLVKNSEEILENTNTSLEKITILVEDFTNILKVSKRNIVDSSSSVSATLENIKNVSNNVADTSKFLTQNFIGKTIGIKKNVGGFFGVLDTVLDCWDIFKTIFRKKK